MNLKEAFRYQKFLDCLLSEGTRYLLDRRVALTTERLHRIHDVNPDAEDREEPEDRKNIPDINKVLRLCTILVEEKEKLTLAINEAKSKSAVDIDAAVEGNKCRQMLARMMKSMLSMHVEQKIISRGTAYKFNVEGNQTPYSYEIDEIVTENFNRDECNEQVKQLLTRSDQVSSDIDEVMITVKVQYDPKFNVNDSFKDVLKELPEGDSYEDR